MRNSYTRPTLPRLNFFNFFLKLFNYIKINIFYT